LDSRLLDINIGSKFMISIGGEQKFTFLNQDINTGELIGSVYASSFRWGSMNDIRSHTNRIYIIGGWDGSSLLV